jgi:hypothetical protein
MTRYEKMLAIQDWMFAIENAESLIAPVREVLMLAPESPINEALDGVIKALTEATSKLVGDKSEWLDWYATENDFGRKGLSAGFMGHEKPIKTLDDLLDLIEQGAAQDDSLLAALKELVALDFGAYLPNGAEDEMRLQRAAMTVRAYVAKAEGGVA